MTEHNKNTWRKNVEEYMKVRQEAKEGKHSGSYMNKRKKNQSPLFYQRLFKLKYI
jgi:hypothetical protein